MTIQLISSTGYCQTRSKKKRILVFPCGSEIGLEIHRSMCFSTHFELIGASSFDDHGRFVYEQYIGGLPMHNKANFIKALKAAIDENQIDALYPTMDAVAETLHNHAEQLGVRVIGSSKETTAICASKSKTYAALKDFIPTAHQYSDLNEVGSYPIFIKPDRGYGARGALRADNKSSAIHALNSAGGSNILLLEYLPGKEWTVDCFSDRHGKLRFHGVRVRNRVSNGISVNTKHCNEFAQEFEQWADIINKQLKLRGAWFFQAKLDNTGKPKLLEVAARLAGSSALFRIKGVNFALLSTFDAFEQNVEILVNDFEVELDRALCNRYKIDINYTHIYVDLDDCLIVNGKINCELVAFLYKAVNECKHICLITRHRGDLQATLKKHRLTQIFDDIIHVTDGLPKSSFMTAEKAMFIDDSFAEIKSVANSKSYFTLHHNNLFSE